MHERAAMEVGLPHEARKFTPHITLARLTRTRPSTVAPFLADFADFQLDPFEVTKVNLYSAKPSSGGGPYVVEEVFPFERRRRVMSFQTELGTSPQTPIFGM